MLAIVRIKRLDPTMTLILGFIGNGTATELIEPGFYKCGHWNFDDEIGLRGFDAQYPDLSSLGLNCTGVVDTPQQFIARFKDRLAEDPRHFAVSFVHIAKNPGGRDGWRWHKWGEYIGDGKPEHEYLDDEEGFADGVWTYHVYDVSSLVCH